MFVCLALLSITADCVVAISDHGLCVPGADRAGAEADSELVTVPQWALVCGRYVCAHICTDECMWVCVWMWLFQVSATSWKRLSELSKSPNKCVCRG